MISDAFITTIYSVMLGFLGFYALFDFLKARGASKKTDAPKGTTAHHGGKVEGSEMGGLARRLQAVNIPPMVRFDLDLVPGGRGISWVFLVASGALVGLAAGIMGVGGGFLTFPIFVYVLGVSSMTTVGTDIFQIIFTAGWAAISQYAIYGFIFYTLAMGMLLGSLLGIQIGAMATKVVPGITIRGFLRHGGARRVREPDLRPALQARRRRLHPAVQGGRCRSWSRSASTPSSSSSRCSRSGSSGRSSRTSPSCSERG